MYTREEIAAAWREALAVWDAEVQLSPPAPLGKKEGSHWPGGEPLAYIDMVTRQVVVNLELLIQVGARDSLAAVLAHEIGHHVRFPHTLGLSAKLTLLERQLMPGLEASLTNLFFDLQVNEAVGKTHATQLAAVYRGFSARDEKTSPLFWFYLAIYEELWGIDGLAPAAQAEEMEARFPGVRADARMFAQTFWALPDTLLQFVYFCSRFFRYVEKNPEERGKIPLGGDLPEPDLDDWDGALAGSPDVDGALAEARERGWIDEPGRPKPATGGTPLGRMSGLPGSAAAKFKPVLVERAYRRLVEQHLIEIPGTQPPPDPLLPTTLEEWQPGEELGGIDWTASVLARGALAPLMPLRRELEPDVPQSGSGDIPAVEIYLDTSGSMPNPSVGLNAMTLAALVLATAACRRGGKVRGVVYSAGTPRVSAWLYGEEAARRFLLQYAGGGTDYPFDLMVRHARERADVLRVVVSDGDFLSNAGAKGALGKLGEGVARSRLFVALLHLWNASHAAQAEQLFAPLADPRFRLAVVHQASDLAAAARRLADAILPAARSR